MFIAGYSKLSKIAFQATTNSFNQIELRTYKTGSFHSVIELFDELIDSINESVEFVKFDVKQYLRDIYSDCVFCDDTFEALKKVELY